MVFVCYLHFLMIALDIKVEAFCNIICSTLICSIIVTDSFCFSNGNSILVKFHFRCMEISLDGKSMVRLHLPSFIQGVPGGMCQTSGECSLC
jgi:hypothetical protein